MDVTKGVTPDQQFIKIMYDELVNLMSAEGEQQTMAVAKAPPTVILLAGLQVRPPPLLPLPPCSPCSSDGGGGGGASSHARPLRC